MKRLIFSEKSLADLDSVLEYFSQDNPRSAIKFGEGFIETCEFIAREPEIGVRLGEPGSSQRMFTYRRYAIDYRNLEQVVRFQRFLHPSLDVGLQELV